MSLDDTVNFQLLQMAIIICYGFTDLRVYLSHNEHLCSPKWFIIAYYSKFNSNCTLST